MSTYNFKEFEPKWQKVWDEKKVHAAPTPSKEKPPYYILVMFPYPSGNLHMGHVRNYTIGDVLARYYRKKGRAVMHPIGWDAFGLPAENAAIKRKTHPAKWTWNNIAQMRDQLKSLAISYDWAREVATCDPKYYRWNQWIFVQMFKKGLAFQKKAPVNWCDSCGTVLANEQVHEGRCWRCDNVVKQKELTQWFFKTTAYAKELLAGHDELKPSKNQKGWPEQVIAMQKNWIGESHGAYVEFPVAGKSIRVFTTRPDTLFGATFMVLAPEHTLVDELTTAEQKKAIQGYRAEVKKLNKVSRTEANREKTGVFTGSYATNPVNGQKIPVWIADYVLTDYGTGAIMAVPAHDERDFAFARKFDIPIVQVIKPKDSDLPKVMKEAFTEDGVLVNSGSFDGMGTEDAKKKISEDLKKKGQGEPTITYKLRDWLLSRQRYWGTPIPIVYCDSCGTQPVDEKDLPVTLPEDVEFTGQGPSPLTTAESWLNTPCPKCKENAKRETDTMDTFVDSSWYYARYVDPKNENLPFDKKAADQWIPVTQYVGGIEHACMHLIYSRFFHKVLRDFGLFSGNEPFGSLLTQGMVTLGGSAMSKSKGNVVDPTDVIKKYGTDTCRLFILFAAPPTQQLEWSDKQVEGIWRFLNRVWRLGQVFFDEDEARDIKRSIEKSPSHKISKKELTRRTHVAIKRVTDDIENDFGFNTAIAAIMELVNSIYLYPNLQDEAARHALKVVLQLLSPFAPHLSEELSKRLGGTDLIVQSPWPAYDPAKLVSDELEIIVQVNGKLRERIKVGAGADENQVRSEALASLEKKGHKIEPKRVIYVPKKLVNFVVQKN